MKNSLLFIMFLFGIIIFPYYQVEISPTLSENIKNAIDNKTTVEAVVVLKDQVNFVTLDKRLYKKKATITRRVYTVIIALQNEVNSTQKLLLSYIESKINKEIILFFLHFNHYQFHYNIP